MKCFFNICYSKTSYHIHGIAFRGSILIISAIYMSALSFLGRKAGAKIEKI